MIKRGGIYRKIVERFSFLSDVPLPCNVTSSANTEKYYQCCQKLIDAYPEDFRWSPPVLFGHAIVHARATAIQMCGGQILQFLELCSRAQEFQMGLKFN